MRDQSEINARFRARLESGDLIVAPGVFDMISARVADEKGFDAIYMTGYGIAASHLGLPDAGLATYADMESRVRTIAGGTNTPLIADGDTGYGGPLNVSHTVRGYEAAGASVIQLEDQDFPKKCGHTLGRLVIPAEDMALKIRVAVDTRDDPNFLIIARTDSRTAHGLDEALRRAEAYAEAGADILFVESPESEAEMEKICRSFDLPLVANMVEGGRTPVLDAARLKELGYRIAIYPATGFLATAAALDAAYGALHRDGTSLNANVPLYDFDAMSRLLGFEAVWDFDRKYGDG
jgi:2-methylisocitrate lyase-like PEP mutase family enzyme